MKRVQLLLRGGLALLTALSVLELCARIDDYVSFGAPFWSAYNIDTLFIQGDTGPRGKPHARFKKWELNSFGFRGPELRPGTIRILCLGNSETFGMYEAPNKEYPRELEHLLNARAGRDQFQVVNVAYAALTLPRATLRVPEIVEGIGPSFALIYPALENYIWLPWIREAHAAEQPPWFDWRIGANFRVLMKRLLPDSVQTWLREWQIQHARTEYQSMDRIPERNVREFRADLMALTEALRARGVAPVLITHATRFGSRISAEDRHILVYWRKFHPMLKEEGFPDMERRMNDTMREVAEERSIALIDAAKQIPPGAVYFADWSHFTTLGARVMAERIADGLWPLISPVAGTTVADPRLFEAKR